nr:sodium/potassium-transporting ATPase subunit beta-2-like [Maniola hyperantus]
MILAGFFVTMLSVCCKWQIDAKITDSSPGLDFIPRPDSANVNSTLIYYKAHDEASVLKWTSKIDAFVQEYSWYAPSAENRMACSWDYPSAGDKPCDVPMQDFHPCTSANKYNYRNAAPCVFLKLNKLLNWTPEPYNTTEDLPSDMPEDLKQHITQVTGRGSANEVWVSCQGDTPADVELIGPVQYIPRRGFPSYYFPYTNQEGYLSPVVAVLFEKLELKPGMLIGIKCTAWAKNIARDDSAARRGTVHFELMIDE